jgi:AcrR family transcriptional regulator
MVRPSSLSRDRVLAAALDLVDREGLEALSMRRLGESLGVEAMSLYRYVDSKAALLDGVVESLLASMEVREPRARSWIERARVRARALRAVLIAHRNAMPLIATRPAVTPRSLERIEDGLSLLRSAGFSTVEALCALQSIVGFTVGHTLSASASSSPNERSTPSYASLDSKRFSATLEAARALSSWDVDAEFEYGLDALLRGLEAKRRAASSKAKRARATKTSHVDERRRRGRA